MHESITMAFTLDRWVGKVAIVTGASFGIGAAIAEQLVEQGLKVAGFARRKERMEEHANKLIGKKGTLYPVKVDVTNEEEILNGFKWVKENLGPVHILINNAGVGSGRKTGLLDGDIALWTNILEVNVIGLCIMTREAIKDMKANNVDGHIIHINSILGHVIADFPLINVYPATKFAVTALAETLRLELNSLKSKIKITSLSPGLVDTPVGEQSKQMEIKEMYAGYHILSPSDIADAVIYILSTPPHVQIQELIIRPLHPIPF